MISPVRAGDREGMTRLVSDYEHLDIELFHLSGATYMVRVRAPDRYQDFQETTDIDLDDADLAEALARIEAGDTDANLFRSVGECLFKKLFVGTVGEAYRGLLR